MPRDVCCHILGDDFLFGRHGVSENKERAFELWHEGAELGNRQCMRNMAWACYDGVGCEKSLEQYEYWNNLLKEPCRDISRYKMRFSQSRIDGLRNLISDCCGGTLVEVGSFLGESACEFARSGKFDKIYCIDPWDRSVYDGADDVPGFYADNVDMSLVEAEFDLATSVYLNIVKMKMTSNEGVLKVDGLVDVVYLDALHSYESVRSDIEIWKNRVRTGGWICGHDYSSDFPGVKRAVDEVFDCPSLYEDGSWAAMKLGSSE